MNYYIKSHDSLLQYMDAFCIILQYKYLIYFRIIIHHYMLSPHCPSQNMRLGGRRVT